MVGSTTDEELDDPGPTTDVADSMEAIVKDLYTWDDFRRQHCHGNGTDVSFDPTEWLGFDPDDIGRILFQAGSAGTTLGISLRNEP